MAKLYKEVWADPVTKVAKNYGISDVALRKICKKLAVPLPPLGYWAKLAAGKKSPTPNLPQYSGAPEIIRQRYVSDDPVEPDPEHLVARRIFEAQPENQIVVPDMLDKPHPLVAATDRALRKPKRRDVRNLPTTEGRALNISVSEASLPRALRIFDALAKALEIRQMPLQIEHDGKQGTYVTIEGQKVSIRMLENTLRIEREPTEKERKDQEKYGYTYLPDRYHYESTGQLKLGILSQYNDEFRRGVADGKHQRIEQFLNAFVIKLVEVAVARKREIEHRERQHQLWEEQARQRNEREKQKREEIERLKSLEEQTRDWRRAEEIRAYVIAVEAKAISERGAIDPDGAFGRWIQWARHKADWIDPIIGAKCPILDDEEDSD